MNIFHVKQQVKVYKGVGWSSDFSPTHFDRSSPPDFYTEVLKKPTRTQLQKEINQSRLRHGLKHYTTLRLKYTNLIADYMNL